MAGLCFFMKHLITLKKGYLFSWPSALHSYSYKLQFDSFIAFSQILWFYRPNEEARRPGFPLSSS